MKPDRPTDAAEKAIQQKKAELLAERRRMLTLPVDAIQDVVLDYPQPAALVHSFPAQDLYHLIHDIGVEDALPVLALASDRQWEHILDMELWEKDRLSETACARWIELLFHADPRRFPRWMAGDKGRLLMHYLSAHLQVLLRDPDQDPSELGEGFTTFDDVFYIRSVPKPEQAETPAEEAQRDEADQPAIQLLARLAESDYDAYLRVITDMAAILPAESEEELYRRRNIRLEEKGYLPFEAAVGVYQPISPENFFDATPKRIIKQPAEEWLPVLPFYPAGMLAEHALFTRALARITGESVLFQLQTEFAALCNQAISADGEKIREKEDLSRVVQKVNGYLGMGLERLIGDASEDAAAPAEKLIQKYALSRIFRVGYGLALEQKWRADKWRKTAWFEAQGLELTFWGEEWLGALGGLLIKKPLYFDNFKTGVLYREFESLSEIQETGETLDRIMAMDALFQKMNVTVGPEGDEFLLYKNALLTLWARHEMGLDETLRPVALDLFREFYRSWWDEQPGPKTIRLSVKAAFLNWASERSGAPADELSDRLGMVFENLFSEIESEFGAVDAAHLDPRYIGLFIVKK